MQERTRLLDWLWRIPRGHLIAGIAALVLLAGIGGWMARPERHTVVISGLEQPIRFVTTENVLADALKGHGVTLAEKDVVEPSLSTSLQGKAEIAVSIRRAVPLTVIDGGQERKVESAAQTVAHLLEELGLTVGDKDSISEPRDTPIAAGMLLKITRRSEQVTIATEEIPFETVTREDGTLLLGTTEVRQNGEPGLKEIQRRVLIEDGREVANDVVGESVTKEPVPQIVAYGTMGVVSRGGRQYRYTQEIEMIATGYTAGPESNPDGNGLTYTGMRAVRGVVAVDPRVIPLYTRVYVEGYGPAIAADTGGAIRGNRIDLCFDTVDEALTWGVRPVKVYVLSE